MDILLVLISIFCFCGFKYTNKTYNASYISKEQTLAINGIFVILVFLRHFLETDPDIVGSYFINLLNVYSHQLIVVPFLFFSGYGIMTSIIKQDKKYVSHMPFHRIFRTWYHFAIAVVIYIIVNWIRNKNYSFLDNVLAFTGWNSIGNSNWYIFAILFLYVVTYVFFRFSGFYYSIFEDKQSDSAYKKKRKWKLAIALIFISCFIYTYVMKSADKNIIWYNTIFLYPIGMIFSLNKSCLERFMQKNQKSYIISFSMIGIILIVSFGVFAAFLDYNKNIYIYQFIGALLMLFIIMFSMKFSLNSKILKFLGTHIFDIYILQRIPISICREYVPNQYISFIFSVSLTLILAVIFHKAMYKLDCLLGLNILNTQDAQLPATGNQCGCSG